MGELNAKHPSWNSKVTNNKRLALQLAQDGGLLIIGPDELDVTLLKNTTASGSIEVLHDLYPDHLPIRILLGHSIHLSGEKISVTQLGQKTGGTEDLSLLRMIKALINPRRRRKIPPFTTSGGQAITPKEKAEAFENTLSDALKPNPSNDELEHLHCDIEDEYNTATFTGEETAPATKSEIRAIIKSLKRKKATGQDGISSEAIKNLPSEGVRAIKNIINAILKLGHFPGTWKEARVIMIKKPANLAIAPNRTVRSASSKSSAKLRKG
ncbi:hypothetical protein Trydic_g1811 [Trypoxylus dichotomus]